MYKTIKSKFIKEKIKTTKWRNRAYIDTLIEFERLAKGESFGRSTGYMYIALKDKKNKDWNRVFKEVNPKGYAEMEASWKKEEEEDERKLKQFEQEEKKEKEKLKSEWKQAGGLE